MNSKPTQNSSEVKGKATGSHRRFVLQVMGMRRWAGGLATAAHCSLLVPPAQEPGGEPVGCLMAQCCQGTWQQVTQTWRIWPSCPADNWVQDVGLVLLLALEAQPWWDGHVVGARSWPGTMGALTMTSPVGLGFLWRLVRVRW